MAPLDLSKFFIVGISSSALFNLQLEDKIYREHGLQAFADHQISNEQNILQPGTGFPLVEAILRLNDPPPGRKRVIVIVMSKNSVDTSLRVLNSIQHYGIDIQRGAFVGGAGLPRYLKAFSVDLFLSSSIQDVQDATNAGFAAGLIYPYQSVPGELSDGLRIAFDGDAVLFSDESEQIYQQKGLDVFLAHEKQNAYTPLADGPFARFFRAIAAMQKQGDIEGKTIVRTALVTARNSPADERVIRTLRSWNVRVDEAFFMGGASKVPVLEAFRPHIFFDDQDVHCLPASTVVPTARVFTPTTATPQELLPFDASKNTDDDASNKKPVKAIPAVIVPLRDRPAASR